jgi:DNA-binding MarR family transcriptional regulator
MASGLITGAHPGCLRGLVKRPQHPEDGRMVHIELTERALQLFKRVLLKRIMRALLEKVERNLPTLGAR